MKVFVSKLNDHKDIDTFCIIVGILCVVMNAPLLLMQR